MDTEASVVERSRRFALRDPGGNAVTLAGEDYGVTLALRRHGDAPPAPSGSSARQAPVRPAARPAGGSAPTAVLHRDLQFVAFEEIRLSSQPLEFRSEFPLEPEFEDDGPLISDTIACLDRRE